MVRTTQPSARAAVLRSALIFSPFLTVAVVALVFIVLDTLDAGLSAGRIAGLTLVSAVTLLLGYQVVQSVRDLFSSPVETTGEVRRRWSRNEFLLFKNDYVFVERDVFRLSPEQAIEVEAGDTVRVRHYPHTSTVEAIEVVARASEGEGARG